MKESLTKNYKKTRKLLRSARDRTCTKEIGKRLRVLRCSNGFTQETIGDALGVIFQQIQKYENGQNDIKPIRMMAICRYFGVSVGYMYGEENQHELSSATLDENHKMFKKFIIFNKLEPDMQNKIYALMLAIVKGEGDE